MEYRDLHPILIKTIKKSAKDTILNALQCSVKRRLNSAVMLDYLREMGIPVSNDQMNTIIEELQEVGAITTSGLDSIVILELPAN
ncbi:hypothetical protein [uncultured Shewanella sp.]|uniref:hypothetical protein n=1 Tax=uncultured Shewanella sp. TaxID=173975 RepID=UPI002601B461|nr:hypothetical protein [uncultured Shewanella sp.]